MSSEKECIIYLYTNKRKTNIHGKPVPYVGQTWRTLETRAGKNGRKYYRSPKFYNAIIKYGWESFGEGQILARTTIQENANYLETLFQDIYDSVENGYNILKGGKSNGKHSLESRRKMSNSAKGKILSPETRKKYLTLIKEG